MAANIGVQVVGNDADDVESDDGAVGLIQDNDVSRRAGRQRRRGRRRRGDRR